MKTPIPPGELILRYRRLGVRLDSGATVMVNVHKYACEWYGAGQADRRAYRDLLYRASRADLLGMTKGDFALVFNGGGSRENIAKCLRLAARHRIYCHVGPAAGAPPGLDEVSGVRRVTDAYVGIDCGGFVTNWIRESGLGEASVSGSALGWLRFGSLVTDLADVQSHDLLIWGTGVHLAIIAEASEADGDTRQLTACEAAIDGLRHRAYTLRRLAEPRTFYAQPRTLKVEELTTVFELDEDSHGRNVPVYVMRYEGCWQAKGKRLPHAH